MTVSCEMITEQMYIGEERWLTYKVISCSPEQPDYTIEAATYLIQGIGVAGGDVSGNCVIDDTAKTVRIKVNPVKSGFFTLTLTLTIADEVIKLKVGLHVCE